MRKYVKYFFFILFSFHCGSDCFINPLVFAIPLAFIVQTPDHSLAGKRKFLTDPVKMHTSPLNIVSLYLKVRAMYFCHLSAKRIIKRTKSLVWFTRFSKDARRTFRRADATVDQFIHIICFAYPCQLPLL